MTARRWVVLLGFGVLILSCVAWPRDCGPDGICTTAVSVATWRAMLISAGIAASSLLLMAWMLRWAWLLTSARQRLAGHAGAPVRPSLARVMAGTGVQRVTCLTSSHPAAFCSGSIRPRVYVTTGLLDQLEAPALAAVLLHEEEHRRRRDPLRKVLLTSAADVLFFLPVTRWLAERHAEGSELAADRAAITAVGPQAVASALWRMAHVLPSQAAAFTGGNAGLRVNQLLGDPLPRSRVPLRLYVLSAAGAMLAAQVAICLTALFAPVMA